MGFEMKIASPSKEALCACQGQDASSAVVNMGSFSGWVCVTMKVVDFLRRVTDAHPMTIESGKLVASIFRVRC